MSKQQRIVEKLTAMGASPVNDHGIIVNYGPKNLSERVIRFAVGKDPYFVLQVCEEALVIAQLNWWGKLKAQQLQSIPFGEIVSVDIDPVGFNYAIKIVTKSQEYRFEAQQKEFALLRTSGFLSMDNWLGNSSWHQRNFDQTLDYLSGLSN